MAIRLSQKFVRAQLLLHFKWEFLKISHNCLLQYEDSNKATSFDSTFLMQLLNFVV